MISSEGKSPEELARLTMQAIEADQERQAQPSRFQVKSNDLEVTPFNSTGIGTGSVAPWNHQGMGNDAVKRVLVTVR